MSGPAARRVALPACVLASALALCLAAGGCLGPIGVRCIEADGDPTVTTRFTLTPTLVTALEADEPQVQAAEVAAPPASGWLGIFDGAYDEAEPTWPLPGFGVFEARQPAEPAAQQFAATPQPPPPPPAKPAPLVEAIPIPHEPPAAIVAQAPRPIPFIAAQVEEIPPPGTPVDPLEDLDGPLSTQQRIRPIAALSTDIRRPALVDDAGMPMSPPLNYAAEALPQLAAQQPRIRGELLDYALPVSAAPAGLEFCYQPLYFEEVGVERYGHSWGMLQPAVSAVHFYGRIPLMPIMLVRQPPRRCTWHAHWTLPGYRCW